MIPPFVIKRWSVCRMRGDSLDLSQEFADEVFGLIDAVNDEPSFAVDADEAPLADQFTVAMAQLDPHVVGDATALAAAEQRLVATHAHILALKPKGEPRFRDWQIDSGQVFGPAGGETVITLRPQTRFRCEKIMATDDSSNPGTGTRILSVTVGNKPQRVGPLGNGMLTQFFSQNALANGVTFDTANSWTVIQVRVRFTLQCNFELTLFGTAEEEEEE